tara:strand:- start:1121 stop:1306 length:186 start_codon:yes stop_codon:yes gene_type:complete
MTKTEKDGEEEEKATFIIVISVILGIVMFYYFCNRNERRDRIDMEERAGRAQARLEIRYAN